MSLSQDDVNQLLNDKFICAWVNIRRDPAAGASFPHPPADPAQELARGLGEHNTQIIVLTPDGKIINALAGYIGPRDLQEELQFSLTLLEQLDNEPKASHKALVAKAHLALAAELEKRKGTGLIDAVGEFGGNFMAVGPKRGVEDHRFVARHPLLPAKSFHTALMVGDAKSVFVWHTIGTPGATSGVKSPKPPKRAAKQPSK